MHVIFNILSIIVAGIGTLGLVNGNQDGMQLIILGAIFGVWARVDRGLGD